MQFFAYVFHEKMISFHQINSGLIQEAFALMIYYILRIKSTNHLMMTAKHKANLLINPKPSTTFGI